MEADALGIGQDAGAAWPPLRLGHLRRRRLDPRAHPRHRRPNRSARPRSTPPRTSPASRRAAARSTTSPGPIGTPASATSSPCAATRPSRAAASRRTPTAMPMRPNWSPGLKKVAPFEISVAAIPNAIPNSADRGRRSRQSQAQDRRRRRPRDHPVLLLGRLLPPLPRRGRRGRHRRRVVPGILPVTNVAQTRSSRRMCGADIPPWLDRLFEGLDDLPAARQLVAATVAAELCGQLYAGGVRALPFLHAEPRRADLRHLPPARPQTGGHDMTAAEQLREAAAAHPGQGRRLRDPDPGAQLGSRLSRHARAHPRPEGQ